MGREQQFAVLAPHATEDRIVTGNLYYMVSVLFISVYCVFAIGRRDIAVLQYIPLKSSM